MVKKALIIAAILTFLGHFSGAQTQVQGDSSKYLLLDFNLQLEIADAVDQMYNFDFHMAEVRFNWLKYDYPNHPLPYFLFGISKWWQMMPNLDAETPLGDQFLAYMDSTISMAEKMTKVDDDNIEANFFLAGAYGFKGRYHSERRNWGRSANAGRLALKYLKKTKGNESFSPEILFGDALFNYYSIWIRENYPMLKPILMFFPKGDKELGIKQMKQVATNAFYTRVEAQYFLMRITAYELNDTREALRLGEYMFNRYPNNPYFHRFYARMLYTSGQYTRAIEESEEILEKIDKGQLGYEGVSGRWASFFIAHILSSRNKKDEAHEYFEKVIEFTEETSSEDSGYYWFAALEAANYYVDHGESDKALPLLASIRDNTKRRNSSNKKAKALQKQIKKNKRRR